MNARRIKIFTFLLPIAVLMGGLSACDQIQQLLAPTPPQMEEHDGEIPVGVVLSITGRFASTFGNPNEKGLELALEEVNNSKLGDRSIKLIIEDDQSTVEGAVEAFNKLIQQDGVPVILGPATSSQSKVVFPIAQENQVVAFSPSSAARGLSAIGDFIFRAALTTDVLIPSGIEATSAKLGYKTAATLYDESDVFSTDSDEAVREALAANGVEVLVTETFQGGDTDFSEQLSRIRGRESRHYLYLLVIAGKTGNPDARPPTRNTQFSSVCRTHLDHSRRGCGGRCCGRGDYLRRLGKHG